mgnify:CR=1 FL=1
MTTNKKIRFNEKFDRGLPAKILIKLYGIKRRSVRALVKKSMYTLIGRHHEFFSQTLREIFKTYYDVEIGLYSHGGCFIPGQISRYTKIGRYCSFAHTVTTHEANHPTNTKSTSGLFFNPALGFVDREIIPMTHLEIGNDVWVGHNAVILPGCKSIGDGAVIGAGAVVNRDIPPYAVAIGNPARVVMYRFSKDKIEELLKERWWERSIEDLAEDVTAFHFPLEADEVK